VLAQGSSQTHPAGVATQDCPLGQVPLHIGGEVLAQGSSQTQPAGVATQDCPVGQVPLQAGAEATQGGIVVVVVVATVSTSPSPSRKQAGLGCESWQRSVGFPRPRSAPSAMTSSMRTPMMPASAVYVSMTTTC